MVETTTVKLSKERITSVTTEDLNHDLYEAPIELSPAG